MREKKYSFALLGGDMRQAYLSKLLHNDGHNVSCFGFDKCTLPCGAVSFNNIEDTVSSADIILLPLPVCNEQGRLNTPLFKGKSPALSEIFDAAGKGSMIFGGIIPLWTIKTAEKSGFTLYDYFNREELTIQNAVPTAEGALQIAMEELPITLHDSSCLVIGYGRIGRYLSYCLKALGAKVTVSARRLSDLAWASAFGYTGIKTSEIKNHCKSFDVIFNTVPSQVLTSDELSVLPEGCLCIDLASKPGGINFEAAQELGVKVIWALSLPGKVAPFTSGKIIKNAVYNILDELEAKDI